MLAVGLAGILGACGDLDHPEGVEIFPTLAAAGFEQECRVASDCPGKKCIRLGQNLQSLPGLCSRACISDEDCGEEGICFALGKAGPTCLAKCRSSVMNGTDPSGEPVCPAGLACVPVGAMGERACFVEPLMRTAAERGAG